MREILEISYLDSFSVFYGLTIALEGAGEIGAAVGAPLGILR